MAKRIARKFFSRNKDKTTTNENQVPTSTPDASPTLQHADSAGSQPECTPYTSVPNSPRHRGIGAIVGDVLDAALKVLREVSAPLPPLQAAVGGVCACIDIYKNVSDNTEQLRNLTIDLISRTTFLQLYMDRAGLGASNPVIQGLINDLNNISQQVKEQESNGLFQRIVQSEQITKIIQEFEKNIQNAFEQCKMTILIAIEANTADIGQEFFLGQLKHSPEAYYDTDIGIKFARKSCCPGTRKEILEHIEKWAITSTPDSMLGYWMCGMAGTGKSTIAMSICESLEEKHLLAGTFFCSRQIPECNDYRSIVRTLAYQLARFSKPFAISLRDVLRKNPDIPSKMPDVQVKKLLIEPWKDVTKFGKMGAHTPVIVIDALDECEDVSSVLEPLISAIQKGQMPGLKFFLTSRPEHAIQQQLMQSNDPIPKPISEIQEFILHRVEKSLVQQDIYTYLETELENIYSSKDQLDRLKMLSGTLFIYAATVVKFVKSASSDRRKQDRLKDSIKKGNKTHDMKQLYAGIMVNAIHANDNELSGNEPEQDWMIIYAIITAGKPLSCNAIAELLVVDVELVSDLIKKLQAVCYMSEGDKCIYTFHKSFPDFITTFRPEVLDVVYSPTCQHQNLALACFTVMEKLRFNICDLPSSFIPDKQVPHFEERVEQNIGETLQYCCQFWSYHFLKCEIEGKIEEKIIEMIIMRLHEFLKERGVYWIEAMSILNLLPQCGEAIDSLRKVLIYADSKSELILIIKYLQNLLMQFSTGEVRGRTPHLYLSIIPFWKNNLECKPHIKKSLKMEAQAQSRNTDIILKGHNGWVCSVAFAPNGMRIVSGSKDHTLRFWDATTGLQIGDPLQGHDDCIHTVAFSPDGTRIVSGSRDKTLRIWNATTGAQIGDHLKGHEGYVHTVAFSPDGTRIVSASGDMTLRIWSAITGSQMGNPLQGHNDCVCSVAFSTDGTRIVSGSFDKTLRIWDATTGTQIGDPLQGHDGYVLSVACSPDGTRIVSGSQDQTLRIWDITTDSPIGDALQGHDSWVRSVAFSPDGTRIVSGSDDKTLRMWDVATISPIGDALQGHDDWVRSVTFSPDGTRIVSGSDDETLRIWDVTTGTQMGDSLHYGYVLSVAFSPDGTRIVSGSDDKTLRIWDATTGAQIGHPLQGHADYVNSVAFSPDGTRIVSGSNDKTLRIWNATCGAQIAGPLQGHDNYILSVAFSPDGTRLVSGSGDKTLRIWDATTGAQIGDPLQGHDGYVRSVAFSPDGTRIVSGSQDYTVRIWDATTGAQISVSLQGHDDYVLSVAFSPDGTRLVSGSGDKTLRIWDATTGAQIGDPLQGHDDYVHSVAFSPDGTRIVSGSDDKTSRIWDAITGVQIGDPLQGHDDCVLSVAFSPDGTRIVSGSGDNTLRVWDATFDSPMNTTLIDPHQSFHAHNNWSLSSDGWITFSNHHNAIIWIPPQFRKLLWKPQNLCIMSRVGYTKLSLADCVYGEQWSHCIEG